MPVICTPESLAEQAKCFNLSPPLQSGAQIALLCAIAGGGCGDPTLDITISGSGIPDANGNYNSTDGGASFVNPNGISYIILPAGPVWRLIDGTFNLLYTIPADQFPCGTWSVAGLGVAPAPSGNYA